MPGKAAFTTYAEQESFADARLGDFTISSYQDAEPAALQRVAPHRHTYFEIIWVQEGRGEHTIDFVTYPFRGPCLFLLSPQQIHTIRKDGPTAGGVVKFTAAFFAADDHREDFIQQSGLFDDIDVRPVLPLAPAAAQVLQPVFDLMHSEFQRPGRFNRDILLSYLKIFLLKIDELKSQAAEPNVPSRALPHAHFREFQRLLQLHFRQQHSVAFYADALHLSARRLGTITQAVKGQSPQLLIQARLTLEARRLLYHSSLSVKEIAGQLGFTEASYFVRFFRQQTGQRPGDFRRSVQ